VIRTDYTRPERVKRIDFTHALAASAFSAAAGPVAAQTGNPTVIRLGTNASDDITPLLCGAALRLHFETHHRSVDDRLVRELIRS
jgi:hypothetical protein